jgi:hypothetical protein
MAKLSDLFGRNGEPGDAGPAWRPNTNGNGGRHISLENYSDVGLRIGEENEVLHNLPTDTGRKIGELDDLKKAFDKLAQPFNATLRAPEQEKIADPEPFQYVGRGARFVRDATQRVLRDR